MSSGPASSRLVVVDYGVNNVGSVINMFRRIGVEADAVRTSERIAEASAIVLPGIGAFDAGIQNLKSRGLFEAIQRRVRDDRVPILGICLGMQLLGSGSEEGKLEGLGLVPAFTRRFAFEGPRARDLKVPHMGWNRTKCLDRELFAELDEEGRFYYVHSYHVVCEDPRDVAASCIYGIPFAAALRRDHVMGTQFHPEKSHRYGLAVLRGFVRAARCSERLADA
ncbi:MAG: imidazole glycerol phosphate synthase subunit HisH [Labilithrix sp.]|nr:imidazole glycerol phosphate synthase subunit HisH [Labilithrix sp.]MCW5814751.1 imidazole glycerol phosphate synthase subunit HisH [Labilithrix sp.]